jgi:NAD(P)-dependent dehydrogenase (short-subunit alcohol dehydrogenase family)
MTLKDKVAVIYGAGGAIGRAVARAFAFEGPIFFSPGATWHPPKLRELVVDLEERSRDTDHLMTILNPVLKSTKKIVKADFTVGV